jgi:transketolase
MLNQHLHLREDMFSPDIEKKAIRYGYGEGLLQAGEEDPNVVALCADLTGSTKTDSFAEKFPDRFIQVGIGEQSMASVASGLSAMGKVPFFSSYAMFSPGRNWEQIRTTIAYNHANAKCAGSHAGVSVGPDGGTHQAIEDIAITRVIPRMHVIAPCDVHEAKKATLAAAKTFGPFYIRLAREDTPILTTEETPFEIGKAHIMWESEDPEVALIGCGTALHATMLAAKRLADEGIPTLVLNNASIKPMDIDAVISVARRTGAIVTAESHQILGGMGSAVAEVLAQNHPVPMELIGVHDKFGQSGTPEELLAHYGITAESIIAAARKVIERK